MKGKTKLNNNLIKVIKKSIKESCSPRHVPSKIIQIKDIPYTINGKKVELAVKNIIQNKEVVNKDSIMNSHVLDQYKGIDELNF